MFTSVYVPSILNVLNFILQEMELCSRPGCIYRYYAIKRIKSCTVQYFKVVVY